MITYYTPDATSLGEGRFVRGDDELIIPPRLVNIIDGPAQELEMDDEAWEELKRRAQACKDEYADGY